MYQMLIITAKTFKLVLHNSVIRRNTTNSVLFQVQLSEHSPSQAHSAVHFSPGSTFLHLHFFVQPFLHLQDTNSLQILDASGNIVQRGSCIWSLVLIHPQLVEERNAGAVTRAWPQTCPPWYTAHRMCCLRTALVGGMSWTLLFLANNLQRALSATVEVLVLS
jgi:hypothetical protein